MKIILLTLLLIITAISSSYLGYIAAKKSENLITRLTLETETYVSILENYESEKVKNIARAQLVNSLYVGILNTQLDNIFNDSYHINEYIKLVNSKVFLNDIIRGYIFEKVDDDNRGYEGLQNFVKENLESFVKM